MLIEEMSRPLRLTSVTDTDTSFSPQPASSAHSMAASSTRSRALIFFIIVLPI